MTTHSIRWQDFFDERPCERGFARFAEAVEMHGLEAAVRRTPDSDRKWGAEHTYRADILLILAQDTDVDVRRNVALNPHTPAEVLATLANDADVYVRYRVASNAQTPAEVLSALATDADVDVRCCVARNAQTPVETLATLAQDADVYARCYVASNPHTPAEVLSALTQDEDDDVRSIAQDRLQSTDARASLA